MHRYRLHKKELDAISDPTARHRRLVELNVIEQCINLFKTGVVQRRRVETYKEWTQLYKKEQQELAELEQKVHQIKGQSEPQRWKNDELINQDDQVYRDLVESIRKKKRFKYYTTPRVHACVFDPQTGDLKRLNVRGGKSE